MWYSMFPVEWVVKHIQPQLLRASKIPVHHITFCMQWTNLSTHVPLQRNQVNTRTSLIQWMWLHLFRIICDTSHLKNPFTAATTSFLQLFIVLSWVQYFLCGMLTIVQIDRVYAIHCDNGMTNTCSSRSALEFE